MAGQRVLVTVKTYPVLSTTYQELVCTAGFTEPGKWIRIYPVPFRQLDYDKQYAKFQWITAPLLKSSKDPRPESHNLTDLTKLVVGEKVPPKDRSTRDKFALADVHTNKDEIVRGAWDNKFSLVTFKPKEITAFAWEAGEREHDSKKLEAIKAKQAQLGLNLDGSGVDEQFELAEKIPYRFYYTFIDDAGIESRLMIEDWEISALYRNCLAGAEGDEAAALEGVRKMYEGRFLSERDVYLFLGTSLQWHNMKAPNPYMIVGVYAPKLEAQPSLFQL